MTRDQLARNARVIKEMGIGEEQEAAKSGGYSVYPAVSSTRS
jgi:hypothetical protein